MHAIDCKELVKVLTNQYADTSKDFDKVLRNLYTHCNRKFAILFDEQSR